MEVIKNIFIAGAGSFIGGAARYIMMKVMSGTNKGWQTVAVNLIDYESLTDTEKEHDRSIAIETFDTINKGGFKIFKK